GRRCAVRAYRGRRESDLTGVRDLRMRKRRRRVRVQLRAESRATSQIRKGRLEHDGLRLERAGTHCRATRASVLPGYTVPAPALVDRNEAPSHHQSVLREGPPAREE